MGDDVKNIFLNIVASFLYAGIIWSITLGIIVASAARRRRRQLRFFGVSREFPNCRVYVSSLDVQPYGSRGPDGTPAGFYGQATPGYELDATVPLIGIWRHRRLDRLSGLIRERLASAWWIFKDVRPVVLSSPDKPRDLVRGGSVVSIGGNAYNVCSAWLFELNRVELKMDVGLSMKRVSSDGTMLDEWKWVSPATESGGEDFAMVQRVIDPAAHTTYFVTAGLTKLGTAGAVLFLARYWDTLQRLFRDSEFAICLKYSNWAADEASILKPEIVYSSPAQLRSGRRTAKLLRRLTSPREALLLGQDFSLVVR